METFDHKKLEKKWQDAWEQDKIYHAQDNSKKPKKYVLVEFPYPSGEGLHMGHLRPYLAGDIFSRFHRMNGFETLFPIGWDAFGLPAENYAIKKGVHPSVSTAQNVANAKRQLQSWGMGFDWDREVNTTDPEYYKWTQWIFLQLFKAGLAYEATGLINWCPKDKTGLANEEVVDGKCERCGTAVEKKELRQWYLKITEYAEKLLAGLKDVDWPEQVKVQQENWIGRSEGAEIDFAIDESQKVKRFVLLHGKHGTPEQDFFPWLKKVLEQRGFEVEAPEMPNTESPNDLEQADYVAKNVKLDESTVILGHSFGGIVALRLLERGIKVHGVVFAATPASGKFADGKPRPTVAEAINRGFDFNKVRQNSTYFEVLVDLTDLVVRQQDGPILAGNLNSSPTYVTAQQPHFHDPEEPTILNALLPSIKVFTTRPDTLFGATYMVLAPEHPLVENFKLQILNYKEVEKYIEATKKKTDLQRNALEKEKTGVELKGVHAVNPATKEKIPVWIADYVLMGYGTGAIMAVPAHDERDQEFAKKYKLPIKEVVQEEKLVASDKFSGLTVAEAKKKITKEFGTSKVQFKLRDWVFSRQRYWGEPIPLIHCAKCGIVPVPENELPVKLPEVEKYEPTGTGESPLAAIESWVNVKCPKCEGPAKRETNTMPQWAGSSWYWIRYADSKNTQAFADKKLQKHWTPVDVYFGGMEHTTLHLLYARFWNLALFDQGQVTTKEPFAKRVPHGIILAADGEKMSKSRGNVVNPDEIVKEYGADVLRMFEPFLGPHEATVPWNDQGIIGVKRFLDKVGRFTSHPAPDAGSNPALHKLIKKVSSDIENFKFNTAIAAFMEFLNENKELSQSDWEKFLILLAPFAPHVTEEIWHNLGHTDSIHKQAWPKFDEKLAQSETVTVVVQVLGRLRASFDLPPGTSQAEVKAKALADSNVKKFLDGKEIVKEVFVPDKLINFVVK